MKLYATHYIDDACPAEMCNRIKYDGTQAAAAATRKALKKEGMRQIETKDAEVPTNKTELLVWLNDNAAWDYS